MTKEEVLRHIKGGLIVSCQPDDEYGLFSSVSFMVEFARASKLGGTVGIRAEGFKNIKAIKSAVRLPVIGLIKKKCFDGTIVITPDFDAVEKIIEAGADVVAIEVTERKVIGLPEEISDRFEFFRQVRNNFKDLILMADVSTYEEGVKSVELGADIVATTLAGYTQHTRNSFCKYEPDLNLLKNSLKLLIFLS